MSYKALYRTYRPTSFDEVVGQDNIVKTLKNAIKNNKINHAYLFAGPRGTGKTTMAKLFAKALNCEEGMGEQCNHCKNCLSINDGTHPDVIEIDAASNNGVEQVRDLIDKVRYSTILGKYKVYIIDEVHMMTPGAFNALLKTLEEPPANVVFILATTEPHKILPTILSRCQRYDFSKISDEAINSRLHFVLEKEGIPADEEAINLIVSLADGGMRDALSILDQVLAYSSNSLNAKDVLTIFQLESKDEKIALINDLNEGNTSGVLDRIHHYNTKGSDIRRLTSDLMNIYKDILIFKKTNSDEFLTEIRKEDAEYLSSIITSERCIKNIEALIEALKDFKGVSQIFPVFEISLLKICSSGAEEPAEEVKVAPATRPIIKEEAVKPQFNTHEEKVEKPTPIKKKPVFAKEEFTNTKDIEVIIPQKEEEVSKPKSENSKNVENKPEEVAQPSLFDIDMLANVDKELLYPIDIRENEDGYKMDEELIINIFTVAKKEIKNKFVNNWEKLKMLTTHPDYGTKAQLLYESHLLVATKNILIVTDDSNRNIKKINALETQKLLQGVTQIAFKKKMFVYGLNRPDSIALQQKFINLKQVNKLEKPSNIEIQMIGEKE